MGQSREVVGVGTVIQTPAHGPELCLGVLMLSLPPQGGGTPITNWDWSGVTGYESVRGTTWGDYEVVGTYDGQAFTLTRPPVEPRPDDAAADLEPPPCTPCPEPEGGWRVLDPSRTTDRLMHKTLRKARRLDGYAGAWLDQSINPAAHSTDEDDADLMNDPTRLIINVAVTRDPGIAERQLRAVWGGALCVSLARHTKDELAAVQDAVLDDVITTGNLLSISTVNDQVDVEVIFDDGGLQEDLDRRYGAGLVIVTSALRPLERRSPHFRGTARPHPRMPTEA